MSQFDTLVADTREAILEAAEYSADYLNSMSRSRLEEWLQEEGREQIDSMIPVYNHEIMQLASDSRVWSQNPEDLATTGSLILMTQACIYLALEEAINDDDSLMDALVEIADRETVEA